MSATLPTVAITSTLGLLDEPHAFSQMSPLTTDQFERAAADRGFPFGNGVLAQLHRDRVLVPLLGIDYDARALIRRSRLRGEAVTDGDVERAMFQVNSSGEGLRLERGVGDLFDPAERGYEPWTTTKTYRGKRYMTRRYLYSPYQLLGIRLLRDAFPRGYPPPRRLRALVVPWAAAPQAHLRQLATLLSALEAAYRPAVIPRLAGFSLDPGQWARYRTDYDIERTLGRLGRTGADLLKEAEDLLSIAHSFDPLRDWQPLVDFVHYEYLAKLRGEPLLAWEHRVAAEMLLLAYEDLARRQHAEPLPELRGRSWAPRHYRIAPEHRNLDEVLMRFGLSPHPSVLVIAEGEIEEAVLRQILAERLLPGWETRIRLHSQKGTDRDVRAIAEFVAPAISGEDGEWIELSRPPVRIVIAGDPEGPLASVASREAVHRRWLDRLIEGLPRKWRGDHMRGQLGGLIEVFVWGEAPTNFEYAHFTDEELADGILAASKSPDTPDRNDLIATLADYRRQARNIRSMWDRWGPPSPTKTQVVEAFAPTLRERVQRELDGVTETPPEIPIARLALRLIELAAKTPRAGSVVLQRPPAPDAPGP
jgi:hypothetical protein